MNLLTDEHTHAWYYDSGRKTGMTGLLKSAVQNFFLKTDEIRIKGRGIL